MPESLSSTEQLLISYAQTVMAYILRDIKRHVEQDQESAFTLSHDTISTLVDMGTLVLTHALNVDEDELGKRLAFFVTQLDHLDHLKTQVNEDEFRRIVKRRMPHVRLSDTITNPFRQFIEHDLNLDED
jgi:hypothetical protein